MWLIGQRCKCGDTLSWLILIGRGLDLKKQKEEKWVRWTRFFALLSWQSKSKYPVMMAKRIHPFPFRTRKLSSSALMVLGGRPPGRVGRCRNKKVKPSFQNGGFNLKIKYSSLAQSVEHMTVNHRVVGSSPTRGAKKIEHTKYVLSFFFVWF